MPFTQHNFNHRQRQWAIRQGLVVTKDQLTTYEDNLFEPLSPQALIDFKNGNGNELDGNMRSLIRSSSALAANFFHYWSRYDWPARRPLHNALGTTHADGDIRFEYKTKDYPLKAYVPNAPPPNIDVVVHYSGSGDGQPLALGIESKLHELFDRKKMTFGDTYAKEHWWADRGLPKCEALVDRIKKGSEKYEHLGADQLLKHTLGLATEFEDRFSLLYLYYDFADEPAAQQHRDEIVQFEAALGGEIKFKPMTYQALYDSLLTECQNSNSITLHKPYLDNRHFDTFSEHWICQRYHLHRYEFASIESTLTRYGFYV